MDTYLAIDLKSGRPWHAWKLGETGNADSCRSSITGILRSPAGADLPLAACAFLPGWIAYGAPHSLPDAETTTLSSLDR